MALFNQIVGTQSDNILTTTNGQDIVLASGGNDRVTVDFQSVDYIIGGDGQDTVIAALPYSSFSISSHPGITDGYIVRYTGTDGKIVANIVKGVESFEFSEGTISLQDFIAGKPIDNSGTIVVSLDGRGAIDSYETIDAGTDDFLYKDDLNLSNYVVINNFTQGDSVEITADQDDIISIINDGQDVIITNNSSSVGGNTIISSITLIGVASADNIISDEAAFEQAVGFDALNINVI